METVKFLNIQKVLAESREEYIRAMTAVLDEASFIGGERVSRFEKEFAAWVGPNNFCVGVANGTDAITLAAKSLALEDGAEAIAPAMTYVATVAGLVHAGLKVRLVDVSPGTWLMDTQLLKKALTKDTRLFVPVHLYGQMAPMDEIQELGNEHDIYVLEDAAQAHGSTWKNHPVGHYSDIASYSFYPGKNLGALGDAGAVLSQDEEFITRCRALGNQGGIKKYEHYLVGYNSRLDALQAALLSIRLKSLSQKNAARKKLASLYMESLSSLSDLELPAIREYAEHSYHLFVVLVENRQDFMNHLKEQGVESGIHYPRAIHQLPAFAEYDFAGQKFPQAERLAAHGVSLPMCPTLSLDDAKRVTAAVKSYFS